MDNSYELSKIEAPIFDIELFDQEQANHFVMARLRGWQKKPMTTNG